MVAEVVAEVVSGKAASQRCKVDPGGQYINRWNGNLFLINPY